MPDRKDGSERPAPVKQYRMGDDSALLSALLANARASLGEIAERLGSYRQKVWRSVQALQGKEIWGYSVALDEKKLGWRRYIVLLKVAHASTHFLERREDLQNKIRAVPTLRVVHSHIITGVDYNFMVEVICQNRIDLQVYLDLVQSTMGTILERPPKIIESVFSLRLDGFDNPDESGLETLVQEMGIVRPRLGAR